MKFSIQSHRAPSKEDLLSVYANNSADTDSVFLGAIEYMEKFEMKKVTRFKLKNGLIITVPDEIEIEKLD